MLLFMVHLVQINCYISFMVAWFFSIIQIKQKLIQGVNFTNMNILGSYKENLKSQGPICNWSKPQEVFMHFSQNEIAPNHIWGTRNFHKKLSSHGSRYIKKTCYLQEVMNNYDTYATRAGNI